MELLLKLLLLHLHVHSAKQRRKRSSSYSPPLPLLWRQEREPSSEYGVGLEQRKWRCFLLQRQKAVQME
jgi:hypothetical protein